MSSTALARFARGTRLGRPTGRFFVILGLGLLTLLGCVGLLSHLAFDQYSSIKWAATVLGPLCLLLLALSTRPATYVAAVTVAALPFFALGFSFGPIHRLSPVLVLIGIGVLFSFLTSPTPVGLAHPFVRPRSRVGQAAVLLVLLSVPSALRGSEVKTWLLQIAVVAGVGYLVCRAQRLDPSAVSFVLAAFVGSMGLQGILAIREFQTGHVFNPYGGGLAARDASYFFSYEGAFRPAGAFYDPISLANILALVCPIAVAMASQRNLPVLLRAWYAGSALFVASGLVLTLSRMSWIGATAGIVVVIALSPARDRLYQVGFIAISALTVSATAVAIAGTRLTQRFSSIFHPTATGVPTAEGDQARQYLWHAARRVFEENPFFGVGRGELYHYLGQQVAGASATTHAHNTYLQYLAEGGLIGAAMIGLLAWATASDVRDRVRESLGTDLAARAAAGAVMVISVTWLTDYTIRYTGVLACMAIPFILLAATHQDRERALVGHRLETPPPQRLAQQVTR